MRTKNAAAITQIESDYMGLVKALPCSVCDAKAPSEAHHQRQGHHFTAIALCHECHKGAGGWHGDKTRWRIYGIDAETAANKTIGRLAGQNMDNARRRHSQRSTRTPSKVLARSA